MSLAGGWPESAGRVRISDDSGLPGVPGVLAPHLAKFNAKIESVELALRELSLSRLEDDPLRLPPPAAPLLMKARSGNGPRHVRTLLKLRRR